MSRPADRRMFYTIDGLRGVAALLVVCRHIVPLHGGQLDFQSSYLAVELFFPITLLYPARRHREGLGEIGEAFAVGREFLGNSFGRTSHKSSK